MESVNTQQRQAVQETFDQWAKQGRGESMAKGHWPMTVQLLEQFELAPGQRFLDIGCGNGYAVAWAANQVGPTGSAVGVDLSPEMIAVAQHTYGAKNIAYQVADVMALPFDNASFDAILNIESLYYYPDIPKALLEIFRVLRPGGRFAAMVDFYKENPYSAVWSELLPIPVTYLSEPDYTRLLEAAGFTMVRTERLFNPTPVDPQTFEPGWGYNTVEDVLTFRQKIGSLGIWGTKPKLT